MDLSIDQFYKITKTDYTKLPSLKVFVLTIHSLKFLSQLVLYFYIFFRVKPLISASNLITCPTVDLDQEVTPLEGPLVDQNQDPEALLVELRDHIQDRQEDHLVLDDQKVHVSQDLAQAADTEYLKDCNV